MAIEIVIGAILGYFTLWVTFFSPSIDSFKANFDDDAKECESNGSQFLENSIHDSLYGYENADTFSDVSHPNLSVNNDSLESISSNRKTKYSNESSQMQQQVDEEYFHPLSDIIVNASNDEKTYSNGRNQIQRFDFSDEENGLIYTMNDDVNNEGKIKHLDGVCIPKVTPNNLNLNLGNYGDDDNFSCLIHLENIFKDLTEGKIEKKFNDSESTDKQCVFAATSRNTSEIPCKEIIYDLTTDMIPVNKNISSNEEINCQLNIAVIEKNEKIKNSTIISEDKKVYLKCENEQVPEIINHDTTIETPIIRKSIEETEKENSYDSTDDFKLQKNNPHNKESEEDDFENITSNQDTFDFFIDKKQTNKVCKFKQAGFVKKQLEQSIPPNIGVRASSVENSKEVFLLEPYPSQGRFSKDLNEKLSRIEFGHTSKNAKQNIWETFSGIELKDWKLQKNEAVVEEGNTFTDVIDDIAENLAKEATKATSQHFSRNKNDVEYSSDSESLEAISDVSFNSEVSAPPVSKDPNQSSVMEGNQAEGHKTAMAEGNTDATQPKSTFREKCSFLKKLKMFFTKTVQKPFKILRVSTKKLESQQKDPDLSLFNCEVSSDKSDFTFEPGPLLLRYLNEDPFDNKTLEKRDEIQVSTRSSECGASGQMLECTRQKPCVNNKKQREREIHALYFQGVLNEGKKVGVARKRFEPKKWFMKKTYATSCNIIARKSCRYTKLSEY